MDDTEKRINKEKNRLKRLYKNIDENTRKAVEGLICCAAFMRVSLEDFEKDLKKNGYVELFSQSEKQEPYERKRPVADLYNTMNANYQKIIKQLSDLLPRELQAPQSDSFDEFVTERKEV